MSVSRCQELAFVRAADRHDRLTRREFLKATACAGAAAVLPGCAGGPFFDDRGLTAATAILRADYDDNLLGVIEAGLAMVPPPPVAGRRVLLKPNLVDLPREGRPAVTDPAVILAAAEAFRRRGAAEVFVADGPSLQRDAWQIMDATGLTQALAEQSIRFEDLGTSEVIGVANAGRRTGLDTLHFSQPAWGADLLVSLPKMKAHHWAGATLAMKNLFGIVAGEVYGWPRNIFHRRGLHTAVFDFNVTRPADYAIIDGVVGMEGDGPIRGTAIRAGVIVMGSSLPAVDATAARVMALQPERIDYLASAAGVLGPISEANIEQRGESIASVRTAFSVVPHLSFLKA
jgi:uncharacterized protein (DUF362 family)